jgi:hypothetical protein
LSICCRALSLSRRELSTLVALFVLSLPAVTARLYSSDEVQYYSYLRSLWFDHDVSFENEYRYFYDRNIAQSAGFRETFLVRTTDVGRRINFATIGAAMLWAPFYAAGDLAARALHASGRDVAVDGFSKPYVAAVAYGSACYGFLAVLLSIRAARRVTGSRMSSIAGIAVWIGTPLLFYMYIAPPYSHACSAFAVALFVTVWLHVRRTWTPAGAAALGLTGALMAMVREQDVFFLAGPALDLILTQLRGRGPDVERARSRQTATVAAAGCGAFLIGVVPQLLAYQALNGRPGPASYVTRKMTWYAPHALQVLASPEHGFLVWTPLAALALVGLAGLARRGDVDARRIGQCALVMIAAQAYVAGSVESWTVAGAFGQRRFVAVTVLLVIGLAALTQMLDRTSRRVAAGVAVLAIWWNIALTGAFGIGLMDRQRLEPVRNAYDAFVTLPRIAPDLAWRYLFDRESFYRTVRRTSDPPE